MKRLLLAFLACILFCQIQAQIQCKILEKDTHEPIIGATVMIVGTKKIIAVSDQNGCFVLSEGFNKPVRISCLGYKSI